MQVHRVDFEISQLSTFLLISEAVHPKDNVTKTQRVNVLVVLARKESIKAHFTRSRLYRDISVFHQQASVTDDKSEAVKFVKCSIDSTEKLPQE